MFEKICRMTKIGRKDFLFSEGAVTRAKTVEHCWTHQDNKNQLVVYINTEDLRVRVNFDYESH